MGANDRRRKAAREREQTRVQTGGQPTGPGVFGRPREDVAEPAASYDKVGAELQAALRPLDTGPYDDSRLLGLAQRLLDRVAPVSMAVVQSVVAAHLAEQADRVLARGWAPHDLGQLVTRSGAAHHLPALVTVLHDAARRTTGAVGWRDELDALGADPRTRFTTVPGLASALLVGSLLSVVPLLDTTGVRPPPARTESHPKLARVRALLAKAESTTFDEEADALTAKAQELIARYSLERLLATEQDAGSGMVARRVWLDPPYVRAKGHLVHVVARANHARTALSTHHGYAVVVGAAADLDATELLVTSLMVQADRAMLRHGSRVDRRGASRTRSFRQAFLIAYANRIGQRLEETSEAVMSEDDGRHLPVLRAQVERASAAFEAAVPHSRGRGASISNSEGYVAGLAAADLAQLGVGAPISRGGVDASTA